MLWYVGRLVERTPSRGPYTTCCDSKSGRPRVPGRRRRRLVGSRDTSLASCSTVSGGSRTPAGVVGRPARTRRPGRTSRLPPTPPSDAVRSLGPSAPPRGSPPPRRFRGTGAPSASSAAVEFARLAPLSRLDTRESVTYTVLSNNVHVSRHESDTGIGTRPSGESAVTVRAGRRRRGASRPASNVRASRAPTTGRRRRRCRGRP